MVRMQHRSVLQSTRCRQDDVRRLRYGWGSCRRDRGYRLRLTLGLTLRQDADQHGYGMPGFRSDHLPCRIAVEVDAVGADNDGLQKHRAFGVGGQRRIQDATRQVRKRGENVGGNADLQRPMG
jgi:hypothetical protein